MNETVLCADCHKPTCEPLPCETCGKVVCPECEHNDENLLHVWCVSCAEAQVNAQRPELAEWQKHVIRTDEYGPAWCGQGLSLEWRFQSAEHAILAVAQGQHLQPCPACVDALMAQLRRVDRGHWPPLPEDPTREALEELEVGLEIVSRDAPDVQLLPAMLKFLRAAVAGKGGAMPGPVQQIVQAAAQLYDNRLGWSDGRNPYAPPELWDDLGRALGRDAGGFCCNAEAQQPEADPRMEALYRACRATANNIAEFGHVTDGEIIWGLEGALGAVLAALKGEKGDG